jgi:hypothetical protein
MATPEPGDVFSSGRGADCVCSANSGSNGAKYSVQMAQDCPAFTRSHSYVSAVRFNPAIISSGAGFGLDWPAVSISWVIIRSRPVDQH